MEGKDLTFEESVDFWIKDLIVTQQKVNTLLNEQSKVLQRHQDIIIKLVNINAKLVEEMKEEKRFF